MRSWWLYEALHTVVGLISHPLYGEKNNYLGPRKIWNCLGIIFIQWNKRSSTPETSGFTPFRITCSKDWILAAWHVARYWWRPENGLVGWDPFRCLAPQVSKKVSICKLTWYTFDKCKMKALKNDDVHFQESQIAEKKLMASKFQRLNKKNTWQRVFMEKCVDRHLSHPPFGGWAFSCKAHLLKLYAWVRFPQETHGTNEPRKKPSYFPLYWMVNRDPYNGLL